MLLLLSLLLLLLLIFSLCLSESLTWSSTDQARSRMQHPRALRASTSGQPHWPAASTPALVRAPATVQYTCPGESTSHSPVHLPW